MTDAELVVAARGGDAEAWQTLYRRYLPSVWRQAYALISDAHGAEDVTSETMLALLEGIDRLESDTPKIAGWLRSVVKCKAADHHRKAYRTRDKLPLAAGPNESTTGESNPAGPLEIEETRRQVWQVLDDLPERQRTILEWKYFDALRIRVIAERLGETEKAVETVLYRARREFRRLYELEESSPNRARFRRETGVEQATQPDMPHES